MAIQMSHIEGCATDLIDTVQTISHHFPDLLPLINKTLNAAISIKLVVDVPVSEGMVAAKDLKEKGISVEATGSISVVDLAKQWIVIGRENSPAEWRWDEREIRISHSSYADRDFGAEEVQVMNLLFEMHNALQTPRFQELCYHQKGISKLEFTRKFEEIEHKTSLMTLEKLEVLIGKNAFTRSNNAFECMYRDPELNLLFQQVGDEKIPSKHAFVVAAKYDVFYPSVWKRTFKGSWATPFDENNLVHRHVQKVLGKVLIAQLQAISGGSRTTLDRKIKKINEGCDLGEEWAEMTNKNLVFFQQKYQDYVAREKPERVVNILHKVPESCTKEARPAVSLLDRLKNAITTY